MSQMQRRGGNVFYWNTECSYDPERAVRIGLDLNKVAVSQPGTCEEAFEMLGHICQNVTGNVPTLVAWDTFSATPTLEEVYGTGEEGKKREKKDEMIDEVSLGGKGLGAHARIVSQQMRKLQGRMESKNVTLVVVLQSKEKIDLTWGSGVTYLAEKPWYFYSNVQFECKRVGYVKSGEVTTGIRVSVSCRKNKVGPPFKVATVDCLFSTGYDISGMDLEQATKNGIISVLGGGWFTYAAPTGVVKFTREPQANSQLCWKELLEKYPQINDALRGVTENASVITEEE
jgi:recombination protein RecA